MILWDCEISVCRHPLESESLKCHSYPKQRADKSLVDSREPPEYLFCIGLGQVLGEWRT